MCRGFPSSSMLSMNFNWTPKPRLLNQLLWEYLTFRYPYSLDISLNLFHISITLISLHMYMITLSIQNNLSQMSAQMKSSLLSPVSMPKLQLLLCEIHFSLLLKSLWGFYYYFCCSWTISSTVDIGINCIYCYLFIDISVFCFLCQINESSFQWD